jgi:hypothetical protein
MRGNDGCNHGGHVADGRRYCVCAGHPSIVISHTSAQLRQGACVRIARSIFCTRATEFQRQLFDAEEVWSAPRRVHKHGILSTGQ